MWSLPWTRQSHSWTRKGRWFQLLTRCRCTTNGIKLCVFVNQMNDFLRKAQVAFYLRTKDTHFHSMLFWYDVSIHIVMTNSDAEVKRNSISYNIRGFSLPWNVCTVHSSHWVLKPDKKSSRSKIFSLQEWNSELQGVKFTELYASRSTQNNFLYTFRRCF